MYCTLLYFVLYCTCIGDLTASILLTLVITDLSCHWTRYNLLNYILTLHSLAAVQALGWSPSAGATKGRGETGAKSRTSSGGTYILCCTVLYYTELHCTLLHYTILYCIVPYHIVLYCTVPLYSTWQPPPAWQEYLHSSGLESEPAWKHQVRLITIQMSVGQINAFHDNNY